MVCIEAVESKHVKLETNGTGYFPEWLLFSLGIVVPLITWL